MGRLGYLFDDLYDVSRRRQRDVGLRDHAAAASGVGHYRDASYLEVLHYSFALIERSIRLQGHRACRHAHADHSGRRIETLCYGAADDITVCDDALQPHGVGVLNDGQASAVVLLHCFRGLVDGAVGSTAGHICRHDVFNLHWLIPLFRAYMWDLKAPVRVPV
jgi:hypothetical protein